MRGCNASGRGDKSPYYSLSAWRSFPLVCHWRFNASCVISARILATTLRYSQRINFLYLDSFIHADYYFNLCAPVATSHGCAGPGPAVLSVPSSSVCRSLASATAAPTAAARDGDAAGTTGLVLTYTKTGDSCTNAGGVTPYSLAFNLGCDATGSSSTLTPVSVKSLNCIITISATSGAACPATASGGWTFVILYALSCGFLLRLACCVSLDRRLIDIRPVITHLAHPHLAC
jgi:hypothetical protein